MMTMARILLVAAGTLTVSVLAGCGGGDSSSTPFTSSSSTGSTGSTGTGSTGTGTTTSTNYEMGNGSGASFENGAIGVSDSSVGAGGATTLQVSIVNAAAAEALYTGGAVTVTFSSSCIAQGTATLAPSGSNTTTGSTADSFSTSTGIAEVTYTAAGCSGQDVVTATASVNSQSLQASGTLTVAAAAVGSLEFIGATPTTIGLKGTGLGDTSTVVFKVLDSSGAGRAGATVNFALSTTAGGLSLSPTSAVSGNDGAVQTVVSSGVQHTTVRVTASIASPAVSTQSSQLTVSTGLPTSNSFTLSVSPAIYSGGGSGGTTGCPNVEAYTLVGTQVIVTASLSDRYGNPVPDNTAIAFQTDGGTITPQCLTGVVASGTPVHGSCSVTWSSTNPVPTTSDSPPSYANGRAMILATAIGEESFTDLNGTGYYVSPDPFANLGEPFLDVNESGAYVLGDPYYNFYNASAYEGPASPPVFKGIVCTGDAAGSTCTATPLGIGAQQLMIMSGSYANVTPSAGAIATLGAGVASGSFTTFTFTVTDTNGNPMAAGTQITAASSIGSVTGTGANFVTTCNCSGGPNTYCPASSAISQPVTLGLIFAAGTTAGSGDITISVKTPGTQITTVYTIPVTVN